MISVFSNGTGYDLSKVVKADSYLKAITNQNLTFYFHPCGDTTNLPKFDNDTQNDCKEGYSLCMFNSTSSEKTSKRTSVLGKIDEMDFKNNRLLFPQDQTDKVALISLECAVDAKFSILYSPLEKIDEDRVVSCIDNSVRYFYLRVFVL